MSKSECLPNLDNKKPRTTARIKTNLADLIGNIIVKMFGFYKNGATLFTQR